MGESDMNELVFDYWKCLADVKVKMEEEIETLMAGMVFVRSEWEEERKLIREKNEKDARIKQEMNGGANDDPTDASERDEWSRVSEKMKGPLIKMGGRKMN
ncbi:hypothetical protein FHG87_004640 [Trinorchestia longiramus]|nr:hypothetical protein FHG87_004640 [Trinorchestia longiramus]